MPEVICLGELLIDFCSSDANASLGDARTFIKSPGGAPANVAVAVRRLGRSAGFIGAVGDDSFGEFLVEVLESEGVETSGLVRQPGMRTPLAFVAAKADGTCDFSFYHDAGLVGLTEENIDEAYVAGASALHFGSISRIDTAARAATDKAMRIAADAGLIISYDPNYRPRLWSDENEARRRIRQGFERATTTKISRDEWSFIFGTEDFLQGARQLLDTGVQLVVRSEGADGASFATASAAGHVNAFSVDSVEFTGAGDAFDASLLVDLLSFRADDISPDELDESQLRWIIRRANAIGALTTTRAGAIPALPTRAEVNAFDGANDEQQR
ncbi:MAG: PfkB family carbohydrate kinase [Planctomycetota bacterium]|nr:PfkB family carbohydrate kinase [Planctomycetota bacterium]